MEGVSLTKEQIIELTKCSADPIYFIENYCKIIHVDHGVISFKLYPKQRKMVDNLHKKRRNIILASRQFGKTAAVAGFLCWLSIFHENYNIGVLADQVAHAEGIIADIKLMMDHLPDFLKPYDRTGKLITDNKRTLILFNGTRIFGAATTPKSIRGESINFLYLDEFAIVDKSIADDFINNAYPTISSGETTQIAITSTPKGLNHFWAFWNKAVHKKNSFEPLRIDWWERPGRDEAWKEDQIKTIGETNFNQEYGNQFLGSSITLVDYRILESMAPIDPIEYRFNDFLKIYELPDRHARYAMGVDIAKVLNKDYHACQILRVDQMPFKQVATFHTRTISWRDLSNYLVRIGELFNNAHLLIERNDIGQAVVDEVFYTHSYPNVVWDPYTNKKEPGILTTKKTKQIYHQLIKDYVDGRLIELVDTDTIDELSHYTLENSKYEPDSDKYHDDLIMSLGLSLFFVLTPDYDGSDNRDSANLQLFRQLEDLMPPGMFSDGRFISVEEIKEELMNIKPYTGLVYLNQSTGELEKAVGPYYDNNKPLKEKKSIFFRNPDDNKQVLKKNQKHFR